MGAFLDVLNAVIEEKAQEDGTFSAKKVASVAEEPRQVDVPATPQVRRFLLCLAYSVRGRRNDAPL